MCVDTLHKGDDDDDDDDDGDDDDNSGLLKPEFRASEILRSVEW
jgi:hypothetical protein